MALRWDRRVSTNAGTPFQRRVWRLLSRAASTGAGATLGQWATRRRRGRLRGEPPPHIVVPCHRVVAAEGLGGYRGRSEPGLCIKRWLLRHERAIS
ncbi:MAG: MGMT family protein [Gammaproteobacteria bacterium]